MNIAPALVALFPSKLLSDITNISSINLLLDI